MVRPVAFTALLAPLSRALDHHSRDTTILFDTSPQIIDSLNSTLSVKPSVLHISSPLLSPNSTIGRHHSLEKRRIIDVVINGVIAGGTVVVAANAAVQLYDNIAAKIKAKSDANSCTLTFGTESDDGYHEGYAYSVTTTGSNCDTTALLETIQNAVKNCADTLHSVKATQGCCKLSHGGTWTGHLRLTADPVRYPADSIGVC